MAIGFVKKNIIRKERESKETPNQKAWDGATLPRGRGLDLVRSIRASMSLSKYWFRTAEPAEAKLVPSKVQKTSSAGGIPLWAKYIPVRVVMSTKRTIPGFVRSM